MVAHRPKNIRQLTLYTTGALLAGLALSSCAQPGDATAPPLHNSALQGASPVDQHVPSAASGSAHGKQPGKSTAAAPNRSADRYAATGENTGTPSSAAPSHTSGTNGQAARSAPKPQSPDRCHTSQLDGSLTATDHAAGQRYADLTLRNHSGQTCTLYGYGGLQLADENGQAVPTNLERTPNPGPTMVRLAPGDTATSNLHWSVVPYDDEPTNGQCQPTPAKAHVTPPDETDPLPITWNLGFVCGSGNIEDSAYH